MRKMGNSFHYVLTFRNGTDVPIVNRIENTDVDCVYHYECFSNVSFYSDGKGDVHYGSFRPAITA